MPWQPTLLEDSLDPWLAVEADPDRRRAVIDFLIDLCESEGHADDERPVPGTEMQAFAALVPNHDVVIVWVIAEAYRQLAIRYLYDVRREQFFGG